MIAILATVIGKMKNNKTKQNKKESIQARLLTYNCTLQSLTYYQILSLTPARS